VPEVDFRQCGPQYRRLMATLRIMLVTLWGRSSNRCSTAIFYVGVNDGKICK
jgi:hypothetical protein